MLPLQKDRIFRMNSFVKNQLSVNTYWRIKPLLIHNTYPILLFFYLYYFILLTFYLYQSRLLSTDSIYDN